MMMRILDEQKGGAQIHDAERAEQVAEHERRARIESDFLKQGLNESVQLAVRLALYAGTIILILAIAGACGGLAAFIVSRYRARRRRKVDASDSNAAPHL